jgi:hypothetical protein
LTRQEGLQLEFKQLDGERAMMASYLQEAQRVRLRFEVALKQPQRIVEASFAKGWTPALRSVTADFTPGIEVRDVRAVQEKEDARVFTLHVAGIAEGRAARRTADIFRENLRASLAREFHGVVAAEFKSIEDDPNPPSASMERAYFKIAAQVIQAEPAQLKDGRSF